jgi:hypothetical protein
MNEHPGKTANLRNSYLRRLLGGRARYHDEVFEIIEVLEDGPALVLQHIGSQTTIQADQHGDAHRRVPKTVTLHLPTTSEGTIDISGLGLDLLDASIGRNDPVIT